MQTNGLLVRTQPLPLLAAVLLLGLGALAGNASAQFAFEHPAYAVARDTRPPSVWWNRPLNEPVTLGIAWFGTSERLIPDATVPRTLLCVVDPTVTNVRGVPMRDAELADPRRAILELRYVPSTGAIVGGAYDTDDVYHPVVPLTPLVPMLDDTNYALVGRYVPGATHQAAGRLELSLLAEGSPTRLARFEIAGLAGGFQRLSKEARIFVGDPFAEGGATNRASHTDPFFFAFLRRGLVDDAVIDGNWSDPSGPRVLAYFGEGDDAEAETVFIYGHAADRDLKTTKETGSIHAWFDGDLETWSRWLSSSPAAVISPDGEPLLGQMKPAPLYEQDQPWSGFWRFSPPPVQIGLNPVEGSLPGLTGVLDGTRGGNEPLVAWGLGNSRWANTTSVPEGLGKLRGMSRSHLMGLREARIEYDGGLFVLNLDADENIEDLTLRKAVSVKAPKDTNWSRFSYGGSFSALPGPGDVTYLRNEPNRDFTPWLTVRRPTEITDSLAMLLMRPLGGTVDISLEVASPSGTIVNVVEGAVPLFGDPSTIETNTARQAEPVDVLGAGPLTITLADTVTVEIGDAVVIERNDAVNVVAAVASTDPGTVTYSLEHTWAPGKQPVVGDRAATGPWSYKLIGFRYEEPNALFTKRGVRFDYVSGGRVTIIGAGYRERVGNRIMYVLAGRGGEGQIEQAEMEFAGALDKLSAAVGVDLLFAGNATQSPGTVEALELQLGTRLADVEIIGSPDVISGPGHSFFEQDFLSTHLENQQGAFEYENWAFIQIQDGFPGMFDQCMAIWRHDPSHPNGRAMLASAKQWWEAVEASVGTVILPRGCAADVNGDGTLDSADFFAWVVAYGQQDSSADQNGDGQVLPSDFFAWVAAFTAGCV